MSEWHGNEGRSDELDREFERDLDRLVDEELAEAGRRELLMKLERTPDGWRRCALAFLEAQAWRGGARGWLAGPGATDIATAPMASPPAKHWLRTGGTLAAMAASFLMAFALGLTLRGERSRIAQTATPTVETALATSTVPGERPEAPPMETETQMAAAAVGGSETIWLPTAGESEDLTPRDLIRELEQYGHAVERRQELWPVELNDGSRALVPIERLDVRYTGQRYE